MSAKWNSTVQKYIAEADLDRYQTKDIQLVGFHNVFFDQIVEALASKIDGLIISKSTLLDFRTRESEFARHLTSLTLEDCNICSPVTFSPEYTSLTILNFTRCRFDYLPHSFPESLVSLKFDSCSCEPEGPP